jgi:hypothetical protein
VLKIGDEVVVEKPFSWYDSDYYHEVGELITIEKQHIGNGLEQYVKVSE